MLSLPLTLTLLPLWHQDTKKRSRVPKNPECLGAMTNWSPSGVLSSVPSPGEMELLPAAAEAGVEETGAVGAAEAGGAC